MGAGAESGIVAGAACAVSMFATAAFAQAIEPRAYSPGPVGLNFVVVGLAHTSGGLAFDTTVPIVDPKIQTTGPVLGYARTLDVLGMSGKLDIIVPSARLSGSAIFRGEPTEREVSGLQDPSARFSLLFYGAPALSPGAFRSYRQDLVIGASVQVTAPLGQYSPDRLINLGSNRWAVKPEIGVSKVMGPWTLEFDGAVTLFADNDDFYGGGKREQRPLYSAQAHVVYSLRNGAWASLDTTWFAGGRTTVNDVLNNDLQRNWRVGATLALPIDRRNSVKFYASSGVSARTGNNFDLLGVAWQHRWGAGF